MATDSIRKYLLLFASVIMAVPVLAGDVHPVSPALTFEPNRGQVNAEVRFLARTTQGTIFLTDREIVLTEHGKPDARPLRMSFLGGRRVQLEPEAATGGLANYYISSDKQKWISRVPLYGKVRFRGIFSGVDAVFHGDGQNLEYDFEVQPGGSPEEIAFSFEGADRLELAPDGGLDVVSGKETWHLMPPRAYQFLDQLTEKVRASYDVGTDHAIRLKLGSYDRSRRLVIDPVVEYANVLDANSSVNVAGIQVDGGGNVYVGGDAFANDLPVVNGQGPKSSGSDQIFLMKLDATGGTIVYSTYLAASDFSTGRALALDAQGNAYMAGITGAMDFPLTSTNLGVCSDFCNAGFVAKVDPSGKLVYSTLLASGQALPYAITVDTNGEALVAGGAFDNTLKTVNAYQSGYQGGSCTSCGGPFFAKLNASGTDYVFSSYFGGPGSAAGPNLAKGIALDATGNVILAGIAAADPPLLQPWQFGTGDLFLAELAPDGKTLLFSTRLGASQDIQPAFATLQTLLVGADGVVYLLVNAGLQDFPYSLGSAALPEVSLNNYAPGISVVAVNPTLNGLEYSTFLGWGTVNAAALDSANHLHLAGFYNFFPYPALSPIHAVVSDTASGGFVAELDPTGVPVTFTQFGGISVQEIPSAIAVDANSNIYLAGAFSGQNTFPSLQPDPILVGPQLPVTPSANPASFFAKISPANAPQISASVQPPLLLVRNAGSADLHISNISLSGQLAKQWGNCGTTVAAGTSCVLTVSDANGNLAAGSVTITSDAVPNTQTFQISLPIGTQEGGAPIGDIVWFQDVAFDFPPQYQGAPSSPIPLTIWNVGTANALISSVTAGQAASQTNNCGTLLPGASCTVQVTMTPTATVGQGSLQVTQDQNSYAQSFYFYSFASPQPLLVSTYAIDFGTQQINGVAIPRAVNITNTSDSSVSTPSATLQGDPNFVLSGNTCASALPAHQSCAVAVQFMASSVGTFNGTLIIAGAGGGSQVSLTGSAQNNELIQTTPLGLNFGPTAMGGSQTLSLTLTNSANSPFSLATPTLSLPDYTETDTCQGQIPVAGTCNMMVTFTPQQMGLRRGALTLGVSISSLTDLVILSGSGVIPLQVSPASLNFGSNNYVGIQGQPMNITLQNQLQTTQAYTIQVTGTFVLANNCANPLPAGTICNASVAFNPASVGNQQGTLTVTYPGTSLVSSVALSGSAGEPFSFQAASGSSLTAQVRGGSTAMYQLEAVAASAFSGTVQVSCSGAPQFASCVAQPGSLTLTGGASSNLTVSISTASQTATRLRGALPIFAGLLLLSLAGFSKRPAMACVLFVVLVAGISGCGGGSGGGGSSQNTTPPGTYTLILTGTSGGASQSTTLTLVVN